MWQLLPFSSVIEFAQLFLYRQLKALDFILKQDDEQKNDASTNIEFHVSLGES